MDKQANFTRLLEPSETRLNKLFQLKQLAVKKVAAFCHFQQLMVTLQTGGPGIHLLGADDLIQFRLNHAQAHLWVKLQLLG